MKNLMKQPPDCHSLKCSDKQDALTNFKNDDCDGAIGTVVTNECTMIEKIAQTLTFVTFV